MVKGLQTWKRTDFENLFKAIWKYRPETILERGTLISFWLGGFYIFVKLLHQFSAALKPLVIATLFVWILEPVVQTFEWLLSRAGRFIGVSFAYLLLEVSKLFQLCVCDPENRKYWIDRLKKFKMHKQRTWRKPWVGKEAGKKSSLRIIACIFVLFFFSLLMWGASIGIMASVNSMLHDLSAYEEQLTTYGEDFKKFIKNTTLIGNDTKDQIRSAIAATSGSSNSSLTHVVTEGWDEIKSVLGTLSEGSIDFVISFVFFILYTLLWLADPLHLSAEQVVYIRVVDNEDDVGARCEIVSDKFQTWKGVRGDIAKWLQRKDVNSFDICAADGYEFFGDQEDVQDAIDDPDIKTTEEDDPDDKTAKLMFLDVKIKEREADEESNFDRQETDKSDVENREAAVVPADRAASCPSPASVTPPPPGTLDRVRVGFASDPADDPPKKLRVGFASDPADEQPTITKGQSAREARPKRSSLEMTLKQKKKTIVLAKCMQEGLEGSKLEDAVQRQVNVELQEHIYNIIKTYFKWKTIMNTIFGLCVYSLLKYLKVGLAEIIAILCAFLSFIPEVGAFIAMMLPMPLVALQPGLTGDERLTLFLYVLGGMLVIKLLVSNIIETKVMASNPILSGVLTKDGKEASFTETHPVLVLFVVVITGDIWGQLGMLISVPLIALVRLTKSVWDDAHQND